MTAKPILFYDSGSGGLPYLKSARSRVPGAGYVYLADRKGFPLGEKPAPVARRLILQSISIAVRRFDPFLIVIACNTASVVALDALRKSFSVPFVGVVPAVKPAALSLGSGTLAVVATRQTAFGPYLEQLVRDFADGCRVVKVPVANLVSFAEFHYLSSDPEQRLAAVRRELGPLLEAEVDAVVLGCTHFVLLEQEFRALLPARVALIDSREGVTNRIVSLVEARAVQAPARGAAPAQGKRQVGARELPAAAELYLRGGGGEEQRYRAFAERFGLRYCGRIEEAPP
jgi:glutamate racemase